MSRPREQSAALLAAPLQRTVDYRHPHLLNRPTPPRPTYLPAAPGPLGLRLKKSPSLLSLINSTLASDADALFGGCCAADMGLAPMQLC